MTSPENIWNTTPATFIFVPGTRGPGMSWPVSALEAAIEGAAVFSGAFNTEDYSIVGIAYPATMWPINGDTAPTLPNSIAAGVDSLDAAIKSIPGQKIICGITQGAMVVTQELLALATDPAAPPAEEMTFICCADPSRINGVFRHFYTPGQTDIVSGYTVIDTPNTQYNGIVMVQEYDGACDFPQDRNKIFSVINAIMGFIMLYEGKGTAYGAPIGYQTLPTHKTHILNVTRCSNGGTITTYFFPSWPLPTLNPFKSNVWNLGSILLQATINSGYSRHSLNYNPPA